MNFKHFRYGCQGGVWQCCRYSVILSPLSYSGKMSPMNTREELYHMTKREMAKLKVAERLLKGDIEIKEAAEVLRLSTRQTLRIKKGVRLNGPA